MGIKKSNTQLYKGSAGFSLVETSIAAGLLAVAALGITSATTTALSIYKKIQGQTQANTISEALLNIITSPQAFSKTRADSQNSSLLPCFNGVVCSPTVPTAIQIRDSNGPNGAIIIGIVQPQGLNLDLSPCAGAQCPWYASVTVQNIFLNTSNLPIGIGLSLNLKNSDNSINRTIPIKIPNEITLTPNPSSCAAPWSYISFIKSDGSLQCAPIIQHPISCAGPNPVIVSIDATGQMTCGTISTNDLNVSCPPNEVMTITGGVVSCIPVPFAVILPYDTCSQFFCYCNDNSLARIKSWGSDISGTPCGTGSHTYSCVCSNGIL